ncbi:ribonuclease H-like domain-containing protein [Mesobacillus maritimus]|uniref:ribonuclease H-like domain-containing protein n=1 Tax=Mesobacillus maritimus TaxID=1643336 RepID=UPI00203CD2C0|nr:ribonuclease H-like domain-containing protein [Mesobacillus maritimus]MCM3588773.1 ribonuclease H-like domain-containing protein [Mesobacillus maritimus]MCM3669421.1 ribonuclease H-like domain-containing protein [Mesobacillus maritimus]
MSLKNKLNRLKPHLSTGVSTQLSESQVNEQPKAESLKEDIPYLDIWEKENTNPYFFDDTYCLVRKVEYPLNYQHGHYRFADTIEAVNQWNQEGIQHPLSSAGHTANNLFFFDTETTGLGGGAGNTIFLLGHASLGTHSVTLTQHILPQPGAEVALYHSFLSSIDYTTLVTYNGKAFDWPQVKTRHTLVRDHVPKLPSFGHFDLFHAARRMWKHKIEKMKLTNVEKDILGFTREDDIPGYLAPMIYFDFLERKNPEGLLGVMKHNELDILSLITLYTHLSFQVLGRDHGRSIRETYEVGRWFSYLGEREKAKENFSSIAKGDESDSLKAKHALAFEYKRSKRLSEAVSLWEETAEKSTPEIRIEACIELAKFHEHKSKNMEKALCFCEKGNALIEQLEQTKKVSRWEKDLKKRVHRLLAKIDKE